MENGENKTTDQCCVESSFILIIALRKYKF